MASLKGKTLFITGASRGIGREIALRAAKDGANIVIAAKSDEPHPKLPGTIHSVAEEVRAAGGQALAIRVDVRDEALVNEAMDKAVAEFGGIDALINNASAINLTNLQSTDIKRFDLMHSINTRGVLVCCKAAIPHLKKSANGHIITLSPPINLKKHWLGGHIPYTVTKYSMSLMTLGIAEELRADGVAANCLWPKTTIATAAVEFAIDMSLMERSRTPEIMADAAYEILTSDSSKLSGETIIDEDILRERGCTDFDKYLNDPKCTDLFMDLFVD